MTDWTRDIRERLARLSLRPEREAEIVEELSQHLDDQVRERLLGGMTPDNAKREALADLDAPGALAQRLRDIEVSHPLTLPPPGAHRRGFRLSHLWQDVRLVARAPASPMVLPLGTRHPCADHRPNHRHCQCRQLVAVDPVAGHH